MIDVASEEKRDASVTFAALDRLATGSFGARVRAWHLLTGSDYAPGVSKLLAICVPVRGDDDPPLDAAVRTIRGGGRIAVAEVTTRAEARRAVAAGFSGLIVVGNEAGGWCGPESSFVLMQGVQSDTGVPVWVRGGIGPNVAAGCVAAGAAGVVLEGALLLARESPLGPEWRDRIARFDGSETTLVGPPAGPGVRVHAQAGSSALARLKQAAGEGDAAWQCAARDEVGWRDGQCIPVGQDAALAHRLAREFVTVGGIIQEFQRSISEGIAAARMACPLAEGSPLAVAHGTRYPILQGPMTRVSDVAGFALAVAREGGLPFLALALMREQEVRALLGAVAAQLGGRPWGIGILGFVPPDLRTEQLAAARDARPPFALIAGGRPDQAAGLERAGIATFLHVPSPGLLEQYLGDGSRRFVLEGRECGGHVGPRSSFVLWEQASAVVSEALDRGIAAAEVSLVFAGGIHDARSAALVAALAGPLAVRGVKIGILVGTAYLFTQEAVATGAIVPRYQEEALHCDATVLLESGPGHQVRVSRTPFVARFNEERKRLLAQRRSSDEVRESLEALNVGRLRVATKGIDRSAGSGSPLVAVNDDYQAAHGLYMLGQIATLRDRTTTIAALHRELCTASTDLLKGVVHSTSSPGPQPQPADVAIIGMAAVFPGAANVSRFWSNTLRGFDAITEVPPDRWDWRLYYDPDPKAPDKIVSKWGGFLPEIAFDPLRYGMPPSSIPSIEPAQLIALEVVRTALADAGYAERPFSRDRTAVVLGMGGGAAQLAMGFAFRSYLPMLDTVIPAAGKRAIESCRGLLPEWTEDSFPGFLLNVTAGRIANRLNLGGANYTVDAACGSSLAAASLAVRELETGAADIVVLGGVDTVQNPFTYLAFSKTQAFSPRGRCRPFDSSADGIVISEGVAALVLKRLSDAERDGDRIYAVIKGVGASSDGRGRGLTAPVVEGQVRALERAYAKAGVSPATVGYVEAHGTGTALGDEVEIEALGHLFRDAGAGERECVVGSIKSMIGHTKCAAGLAGLINAALALYHQVLPPTLGIETSNPKLDLEEGPFRLCSETQPWLHRKDDHPRRAGVSAFGFGGTNFHAVLEAYDRSIIAAPESTVRDWPVDLFVWQTEAPEGLVAQLDQLAAGLESGARPHLCDLSHTLMRARASAALKIGEKPCATLVILAGSHDDLHEKLHRARTAIAEGRAQLGDSPDLVFEAKPPWAKAPIAFLFPGQGAQSPGMLRELAVIFPEVRQAFEEFDRVQRAAGGRALGPLVFPPPAFSEQRREENNRDLMQTDVAQPAVGAACVAMLRLLSDLGCEPDVVAGHSYGELVALHAAGVCELAALAELSSGRGRLMSEAGRGTEGAMAAIPAGADEIERLLRDVSGVQAANWNGPRQTVIAGPSASVKQVVELAAKKGIAGRVLPVACAFHTPLVAAARAPLVQLAGRLLQSSPSRRVYSNLDARPHPADLAAVAARLGDHLASPVRFAEMIEAMYQDGARVFVEVGPASTLSPLVGAILEDRPHLAVSCDRSGSGGLRAWLRAVARLVVAGVPLSLERLTAGRSPRVLDLERLPPGEDSEPYAASTWLVNGSRARPVSDPEPARLGQRREPPLFESEPESRAAPAQQKGAEASAFASPAPARRGRATNRMLDARQRLSRPENRLPKSQPGRNGYRDSHTSMKLPDAPNGASERVIEAFQQTMQAFLDVQKSTMLAYLAERGAPRAPEPAAFEPQSAGQAPSDLSRDVAGSPAVGSSGVAPGRRGTLGGPGRNEPAEREGTTRRLGPRLETSELLPQNDGKPLESSAPSGAAAAPDRAAIAARLLETVRERTGYPVETLGLELDMEADLGIDSIKRVEILGKLRDEFPSLKAVSDSAEVMDALARARTLGAVVEKLAALVLAPTETSGVAEASTAPEVGTSPGGGARSGQTTFRRLLEVASAPLPPDRCGLAAGGRVLITDDGRGVADALTSRLEAAGIAVERIGGSLEPLDWTSPSAINSLLDGVRSRGLLAGIIHALPLGRTPRAGRNESDSSARARVELKALFLLAKAAAADLEKAARSGGASLVAATSLGGRFASAGCTNLDFFPGHGGIAGLVKTLAREWPEVRCRVVDFAASAPAAAVADRLADEAFAGDGLAEVGYDHDSRIRLRTIATPLCHGGPALALEPGEPVLISGGARGITALVAAELARAWRPTLLIVGTTPLPDECEPAETAGLTEESELKSALHEQLRRQGRPGNPVQIEAVYQALRRAREVRENLRVLRDVGATVAYAQADVRDARALARVLEGWRTRYGEPAGLIHGAGLIKDKLIRQKTVDSFDRVLETKLDGALNLIRLVRPDSLKFTALFSSIAGRFGNVGQSDYAAANEILNKLAQWLDRRWPGRVLSLIWGPWSGVGMVSQLESHLGRRGLGMIPPDVGPALFLDELRYGRKGEVEVIYAGKLGALEPPVSREPAAAPLEAVS
jgi:acyl transferase domain-containing protein/NAD(P)H-dependent flavin oxidoreductase YrpB (nitropropane dioxygenase family)